MPFRTEIVARGFAALVVAALLLWPLVLPVSAQGNVCPGLNPVSPMGNGDTITVSSTAIGISTADISTTGRSASVAVGYVAGDAIRYWDNGETPTASVGMYVGVNTGFVICGVKAIRDFRMIRITTDATVTVSLYGGE